MNILINLLPIKKGGGQQVAFNFVSHLKEFTDISAFYVVTKGTIIHQKIIDLGITNFIAIDDSLLERLKFQNFHLIKYIKDYKIDLIYTLFGPGLHCKNVKSVTGCAYSNLFFPEVDFWKDHSFLQRCKLKIIDKYRLASTLKSDAIIFENAAMQRRASELFNYPSGQTVLILPSISEHVESLDDKSIITSRLKVVDKQQFNILMLTGWHKNKNITQVPFILSELKVRGFEDVTFVITVSKSHPESVKLNSVAKSLGVENNIIYFDAVKPYEVPSLFDAIDAVALLSLLESFSNNIIEAWHFRKPLFISDEKWSRGICDNAAIYVKRDNPIDIAEHIIEFRLNKDLQKEVTVKSLDILKNYPNPVEKVALQVEFLKSLNNE
ncbi:glycosyltransferase [Chryseobacterium sp. A321]